MNPYPDTLDRKPRLWQTLSGTAALIAANVMLNHYSAPNGIVMTPVVVFIGVYALSLTRRLRPFWLVLLAAGVVSIHDIGIKLYGGAMHDLEGQGFIFAFLFLGLIPSYLRLVSTVSNNKHARKSEIRWALLLFPVLILIHLSVTDDLGLGRCVNCNPD
ncbi:hypothetical protein [Hymenobacter sp. IS2118]|uniref:hypothetical protein n=1 Tax=Hymenobacter sp. IS2118 TaxID=1505605 RepID=UPI000558533D|nr:hypothetical protein [Hymenobacter sp. IS2118]